MDLWIASILLAIAVLVLLVGGRRKRRKRPLMKAAIGSSSPFDIPMSEGGESRYAVVDFQTTGLETEEDRIVQVAWMVLDEEYCLVRKHVTLVAQETSGSREARAVHGLSTMVLSKHGIGEEEMLDRLWQDIVDVQVIVAHNIDFDLGILRASLLRYRPERVSAIEEKETICTMSDFVDVTQGKYPSLYELSSSLGLIWTAEMALHPVAWRNVCLTRFCLMKVGGASEIRT